MKMSIEIPSPPLIKFKSVTSMNNDIIDLEMLPPTQSSLQSNLFARDWRYDLKRYLQKAALVLILTLMLVLGLWAIINERNYVEQTLLDVRHELHRFQEESNQRVEHLIGQLTIAERTVVELDEKVKSTNQDMLDRMVPIGFLYTELPGQKAPQHLWPSAVWTEVSSTYSGVFFRVVGGNAADFGITQSASAPKLSNVLAEQQSNYANNHLNIDVPADGGWSEMVYSGGDHTSDKSYFLKFKHSTDEVRPINMAVRLWIRTA